MIESIKEIADWEELPFSEIIDFQEGPGILAVDFVETGVPLIRLSGLETGVSILNGCNFLNPSKVEKKWAHFRILEGDILLSSSATLGRIKVVDKTGIGGISYTGIIRMRPRDQRIYAPFIQFILESPHFQRQIEAMGVGSVIRHFGPFHLRQMTVILPPISTQHAIVRILGSLDDKIDLNRQMNETLEAMARAIFQSWFVDFDPVRAKAEGRDTGLPADVVALFPDGLKDIGGKTVPNGWCIGKVSDFGEIICGKTPPTKDPENFGNDMLFITIPDMHNQIFILNTTRNLSNTGVQTQPNKTIPPMSICVSCIASPGLVSLTSKLSQTNQQINSIIPFNKKNAFYCYYALLELADEIKSSGSGGSVIHNLNKGEFSSISILIPSESIIKKYHDMVEPVFKKILTNQEESHTLAQIRDALLPKLLNGEIIVEVAS